MENKKTIVSYGGRNSGRTMHFFKELYDLSPEDMTLIRELWECKSTVDIAASMCTTVKGIEGIKTRLLKKLKLKNSLQLVRFGIETGLIKIKKPKTL